SLGVRPDSTGAGTANMDLDAGLHDIVDRSLQVTRAERAILFLGDTADGLVVRMAQDREGKAVGGDLQWSRSIVRRCLEEQLAVRSVVQSDQEALELGQSVYDLNLRAVMGGALVARNRTVGVVYVDSRAVRREFTERDLALFGAISAQLAISLENARLHADSLEKARLQKDFEIARRIQQHLLPSVPKSHPGVDLSLRFVAAETASGDTYDFVPLPDGRIAVMIGDVTGHGVGAALLTHAAQAAMRLPRADRRPQPDRDAAQQPHGRFGRDGHLHVAAALRRRSAPPDGAVRQRRAPVARPLRRARGHRARQDRHGARRRRRPGVRGEPGGPARARRPAVPAHGRRRRGDVAGARGVRRAAPARRTAAAARRARRGDPAGARGVAARAHGLGVRGRFHDDRRQGGLTRVAEGVRMKNRIVLWSTVGVLLLACGGYAYKLWSDHAARSDALQKLCDDVDTVLGADHLDTDELSRLVTKLDAAD